MTRRNVSHTHTRIEDRPETDQVFVDGDTTEAIFRAIVQSDDVEDFEAFVEEDLDVDIVRERWVEFGVEVVVR